MRKCSGKLSNTLPLGVLRAAQAAAQAQLVQAQRGLEAKAAREEELARALATRYEWPVTDGTPALQERYAEEMEKVALAFASDADVQARCEPASPTIVPQLAARPRAR